jgi:threonine/homoserine/homoserine lactone efflux protein
MPSLPLADFDTDPRLLRSDGAFAQAFKTAWAHLIQSLSHIGRLQEQTTLVHTLSRSDLWHSLAMLALTALTVMGSPGPATIGVTAVGAAFGLRQSYSYTFGLILGTSAVLAIVAVGIVSMLMSLPQLAPLLLAASTIYILYLAFRIATMAPLSAQSDAPHAPSFAGGFLLGIANPKAYIAIAAVFTGTTLQIVPPIVAALIKTAVLGFMIVVIHIGWLLVGTSLSRRLRDPVSSRIFNLLLAAMPVGDTAQQLRGSPVAVAGSRKAL